MFPETFSLEEILPLIGNGQPFIYRQWEIKLRSCRLLCFKRSVKCSFCNREGKIFKLVRDVKTRQNNMKPHFNLYAEDGTLMTKDHILPKSYGGSNTKHNLRTMCAKCNSNRGNSFPWDDWWFKFLAEE